jgi:hypothetical protein
VDAWGGDTVVVTCEGAQPDWSGAIEAVVYELARHNGESPLDRGAALRRRIEALAAVARVAAPRAPIGALARAFDQLAAERGWRGEESGTESAWRVVSMTRITVPA